MDVDTMLYFPKVCAHFKNLRRSAEINNINFTWLDGWARSGSEAEFSKARLGREGKVVSKKTNSL